MKNVRGKQQQHLLRKVSEVDGDYNPFPTENPVNPP